MTETARSRIVWFTLLALVVLMLWVVSRSYSAEIPKGGQAQMQGAKLSLRLAGTMPKYTVVAPRTMVTISLAWDASASTNVITNYQVWYGPASTSYNAWTNRGTNLTATLVLSASAAHYFVVAAQDNQGQVSEFSNEVFWKPAPTNIVVTVSTTVTNWLPYVVTNPPIRYFYRSTATKIGGNKWRMVMQRTGGLNIIWQEWTNYWAPFTNTQAPQDIRLDVFTRHQ